MIVCIRLTIILCGNMAKCQYYTSVAWNLQFFHPSSIGIAVKYSAIITEKFFYEIQIFQPFGLFRMNKSYKKPIKLHKKILHSIIGLTTVGTI